MFWQAGNLSFQNHIRFGRKIFHLSGLSEAIWSLGGQNRWQKWQITNRRLIRVSTRSNKSPDVSSKYLWCFSIIFACRLPLSSPVRRVWQNLSPDLSPDLSREQNLCISAHKYSVLIAYDTESLSTSFQSNSIHSTIVTLWQEGEIARDKFVTLFVTWQTCPVGGFDMPKCTDMITNSRTHDLGTVGALETVFWKIRFSNLARSGRVTRTHPLSGPPT